MTLKSRSRLGAVAAAMAAAYALSTAPAIAGEPAVGLTSPSQLVFFDTDTPGTIDRTIQVTGLQPTEGLLAIDFRPGGGTGELARQLYAISSHSRVFTIDVTSGAANLVTGANPIAPLLASPVAGFDFDPQADRLRIVTDAEQNLSLVPFPISTLTGTALTGTTEAAAAAYTENHPGAASTTLFTIDAGTDTLIRQGVAGGGNSPSTDGPDGGAGTTIGALDFDTTGHATSFDISAGGGRAYAGLTAPPGLGATVLHSIDLAAGTATAIGKIGGGHTIRGLALAPGGAVQWALDRTFVTEGAGVASVVLRRSGGDLRPITARYASLPINAAGADFGAESGTVAFAAGETTKAIAVPIFNDAVAEPAESLRMTLMSSETGSVLGGRESSVVTIVDDDVAQPGPDTDKPVLLAAPNVPVNISSLIRSRRLTAYVSCSEECTAKGKLKLGAKTIATGSAKLAAAGTARMRLTVTRSGRAVLRRERRSRKRTALRMALDVIALDGEGLPASVRTRVLLPRR